MSCFFLAGIQISSTSAGHDVIFYRWNVLSNFIYFRDLNNNELVTLGKEAISDLPELITLRLHSQKNAGLESILYNAFLNINLKLENLYVQEILF